MLNKKQTKLIVFEGGEGVGKSTQIELLCKTLTANNLTFVKTREPGGLQSAEEIREIIFSKNYNTQNTTDLLLFTAARHENIKKNIEPNMGLVDFIICDRFVLSTLVYQGFVGGYDIKLIKELHKICNNNLYPDLTIILDVSPQIALKRLENRDDVNKYDEKAIDFHNKVAEGYRQYKNFYSAKTILLSDYFKKAESNFVEISGNTLISGNAIIKEAGIYDGNAPKSIIYTRIIDALNNTFNLTLSKIND
jgi:dTMP kinase